ncbi:Carboxypeptidase regulatory-like domain protein [uncultured archaeon]|nr:Carboxypeptidase regulatory-like domain protein [uncultured archaeon]
MKTLKFNYFLLILPILFLVGSVSAYGWPYYGYPSNYFTPYGNIYIYQFPICGDGICDYYEYAYGTCPIDCGTIIPQYPRCGDGLCSFYEYETNSCPQDCLFASSLGNPPYYPTPTPQPIFCSDGTPAGRCSGTPGVYCNLVGNLTNNPDLCPCPSGYFRSGNQCLNTCTDGTKVGACSVVNANLGKECDPNGNLINAWGPSACGCPLGTSWNGVTCAAPSANCQMTINPRPFIVDGNTYNPADGKVNIVLTYNNTNPGTANIACGNGLTVTAPCILTPGTTQGTCNAVCSYTNSGPYPATKQIDAILDTSINCGTQPIEILPPQQVNGTTVVSVTDCATGRPLQSSLVQITSAGTFNPAYASGLYTDSSGSVALIDLPPNGYNIQVSRGNYSSVQLSSNVQAGVTAPLSVCLSPITSTCSLTAYLLGITPPQDQFSNDIIYNLIVKTGNNTYTVTPTYQSDIQSTFSSTSFVLTSYSSYLLNFTIQPTSTFTGSAFANINLATNDSSCAANLLIPLTLPGGVTLDIADNYRTAFPGQKECFNMVLRNTLNDVVDVSLTTNSVLPVSFDFDRIRMSAGEVQNDQMCVTIPTIQTSGSQSSQSVFVSDLTSTGRGGFANVVLNIPNQNAFSATSATDLNSCLQLPSNAIVYHKITLTNNNGKSDDYTATIEPSDDIKVSLLDSSVNAFQKGTTQDVTVIVDPTNAQTQGDHYYVLKLLNHGVTAFTQQLCYTLKPIFSVAGSLSQTSLLMNFNDTQTVDLNLKNNGNIRDSYIIVPSSRAVTLSQSSITLNAGEDYDFNLNIDASKLTSGATNNININVYSLNKVPNGQSKIATIQLPVTVNRRPGQKSDLNGIYVSDPDVSFNNDNILLQFLARNNGASVITFGIQLRGLPLDWNINVTPSSILTLQPGAQEFFNVTLQVPANSEARLYDGQLAVTTADGSAENVKGFTIDATQAGAGTPFTAGQFISGVSNTTLIIIVLLIIAAVILIMNRGRLKEMIKK